jgi:hypothetical protein
MSNRTAFRTEDYAAILRNLKMRGQLDELARMLNSFVISDEFVYPIIDRPAYKPFHEERI